MNKREGFKLIFAFVFAVYLTSFVSAVAIPNGQCAVVPRAEYQSRHTQKYCRM